MFDKTTSSDSQVTRDHQGRLDFSSVMTGVDHVPPTAQNTTTADSYLPKLTFTLNGGDAAGSSPEHSRSAFGANAANAAQLAQDFSQLNTDLQKVDTDLKALIASLQQPGASTGDTANPAVEAGAGSTATQPPSDAQAVPVSATTTTPMENTTPTTTQTTTPMENTTPTTTQTTTPMENTTPTTTQTTTPMENVVTGVVDQSLPTGYNGAVALSSNMDLQTLADAMQTNAAIDSGEYGGVPITLAAGDVTPVSGTSVTDAAGNTFSLGPMPDPAPGSMAGSTGVLLENGNPVPGGGQYYDAIRLVNGQVYAEWGKGHGWRTIDDSGNVGAWQGDPGTGTTTPTDTPTPTTTPTIAQTTTPTDTQTPTNTTAQTTTPTDNPTPTNTAMNLSSGLQQIVNQMGLTPTVSGDVANNVTGYGGSGATAEPLSSYGTPDGNGGFTITNDPSTWGGDLTPTTSATGEQLFVADVKFDPNAVAPATFAGGTMTSWPAIWANSGVNPGSNLKQEIDTLEYFGNSDSTPAASTLHNWNTTTGTNVSQSSAIDPSLFANAATSGVEVATLINPQNDTVTSYINGQQISSFNVNPGDPSLTTPISWLMGTGNGEPLDVTNMALYTPTGSA